MRDLVLAIDDEPAFLEIITKVAQSSGFAAVVSTDPAVFRASLARQPPTIVFLDLQMPDLDGIQLLHTLAEARCRATVVLMSGFDARVLSMAHGIGRDLGLEMAAPMQKPIRAAELRQLFARLRTRAFEPTARDLQVALHGGHLELVYQPLLTLATRTTIGFEALVRWRHPQFGIIMPSQFIDLAENEGLIGPLTERVLELAVAQIAAWNRGGMDHFVSVNISAGNIVAELPDALARLCVHHGIPPRQLRLELTETAAMANHSLMLEILTRTRLKGFQLAIDDFGTGYSSLVQLHRLPFTELKIDQSFIRGMQTSEEANLIVGAIIGLGRSLHLELIAEGVETEELLQRLIAMGCQSGQGYLFSRPIAATDVPDWLAHNSPHVPDGRQ